MCASVVEIPWEIPLDEDILWKIPYMYSLSCIVCKHIPWEIPLDIPWEDILWKIPNMYSLSCIECCVTHSLGKPLH